MENRSIHSLEYRGAALLTPLWLEKVRQAQELLAKTRLDSNEAQLSQEVGALVDEVSSFPGLSSFDVQFLRGPVQAVILAGALAESPSRQWTNGDFVGRNLRGRCPGVPCA